MIKVIRSSNMGQSDHGWLHSHFHFSFADYYNPDNIQFGALRVVNDDTFDAQGGFDTHPHEDMEIVSYVVDGKLTHRDSLGNGNTLGRGEVQYMSAGTGIRHSEFNRTDETARFLQIWILPDGKGYAPHYGDYRFPWEDRVGAWLLIASGEQDRAPITIHQDMNISVLALSAGESLSYAFGSGRQAYVIQIEGEGAIGEHVLKQRDAAEITAELELLFNAKTSSHYILFDMPSDNS